MNSASHQHQRCWHGSVSSKVSGHVRLVGEDAVELCQHRSDHAKITVVVKGRRVNLAYRMIISKIETPTQAPIIPLAELANGFKISWIIRPSRPACQSDIK